MTRKKAARVDLHTHTTASDGALAPGALVALALERHLSVLAVTDHDSTEGIAAAMTAASGTGLLVLPGIELGVELPDGEVHILGYLLDIQHAALQQVLREMRAARLTRTQRMLEKLEKLGMPLPWSEVAAIAGAGAVGRAHVALAMLRRGYVASTPEAFERYIGRGAPAYVERYRLSSAEAIGLITDAGGLAVLAHPVGKPGFTPSHTTLQSLLRELTRAGLAGIETYYYGYSPATVRGLLALARAFNLVPTGGSDFHGHVTLTAGNLGSVAVPMQCVERLLARKGRIDR